jgi:hypothetical protein
MLDAEYTRAQARRDCNPTPEAEFARHHWHDLYARRGLGTMGFYETYLSKKDRAYCKQAVEAILKAKESHDAGR